MLTFLKVIFFLLLANGAESSAPFRLSITDLPKSLDPHRMRTSSGNFLSQQVYRNFYSYDSKKSYVPELGESCQKLETKWICKIKANAQWSDGSAITSEDFVLSMRRLVTLPSPRIELLLNIRNAQEVLENKMKPEQLGIKSVDSKTFEIEWIRNSPDNETVLMSPLFVPLPLGLYKKDVFSGPYQITDRNNQRIRLSQNKTYFKKNNRPPIEFHIFEENLSVKAYEKGQLDFLRRVPTAQIPQMKARLDFHWYPVFRFDSIAFGPELQKEFSLRKQMAESLKYEELQALFQSPAPIGCPGLPNQFAKPICYKGSQKVAPLKEQKRFAFAYSTWGGDDHRRLAEWLQGQWLKGLNVQLQLQPLENKIFQSLLEKNPPAIFRKGLNLENPSCYNALQIFTSNHRENFVQYKNKKYDQLVQKLMRAKGAETKKICEQALQILMDSYVMIPTGQIHFAIMVNPQWQGWKVNELNHLDLSELQFKPTEPKK